MSKTIRITHYGMDGEGSTVKEAKADAGNKLQELIRELRDADPVVVRVGEWAALVAFSFDGWGYRIIQAPDLDPNNATGPIYLTKGYGDKHSTRKAALSHLAQCAWSFDVDDDQAFLDSLGGTRAGAPLNHSERAEMNRELLRWFAFQRTYRQAKLDGYSDNAAHHIAGGLKHLVDSGKVA